MAWIADPNFSNGATGWKRNNLPAAVTFGQQNESDIHRTMIYDSASQPRSSFAYVRSSQPGGSIAIDFSPFTLVASITVLAWIRVRPGTGDFSGQLAIWNLTAGNHVGMDFTATQAWSPISAMIPTANGTADNYRIEFYLNTINEDLLIDSVNAF